MNINLPNTLILLLTTSYTIANYNLILLVSIKLILLFIIFIDTVTYSINIRP